MRSAASWNRTGSWPRGKREVIEFFRSVQGREPFPFLCHYITSPPRSTPEHHSPIFAGENTFRNSRMIDFVVANLNRFVACREAPCCLSDVDVCDEQPFFAIGLVAEQRPVGLHDRRGGG